MAVNTFPDPKPNPTMGRAVLQDLKAYILKLAMLHFSDPAHIRDPALRPFVYRRPGPNPAAPTSLDPQSLVITTRGKFDPAQTGRRPALVLKRNATKYTKDLAFGGAVQGTMPLRGEEGVNATYDATAGGNVYNYGGELSFTFFCLHSEEVGAELLGDEVLQLLLGFRSLIMLEHPLVEFMPSSTSEAGMLEEYKEMWAVQVQIDIQFRLEVHLLPKTPLLKGILARLNKVS